MPEKWDNQIIRTGGRTMVDTIGTDDAVSLSAEELNRLFNIGIALSGEQDMDVLLESILTAAKEFCFR